MGQVSSLRDARRRVQAKQALLFVLLPYSGSTRFRRLGVLLHVDLNLYAVVQPGLGGPECPGGRGLERNGVAAVVSGADVDVGIARWTDGGRAVEEVGGNVDLLFSLNRR